MALLPVRIESSGPGIEKFMIGDVDVLACADVVRLTTDMGPGRVPTVYVETVGDSMIEIEGIVVQNVADKVDGAGIAAWVRSIDAGVLESVALERDESPIAAALHVLAAWAESGHGN